MGSNTKTIGSWKIGGMAFLIMIVFFTIIGLAVGYPIGQIIAMHVSSWLTATWLFGAGLILFYLTSRGK